jgi:geranylgeranyl diphosphate synthase type II
VAAGTEDGRVSERASPTASAAFLAEARTRVDAALARHLPAAGSGPPRLAEAMRYSVLGGGKRIRPALALAACATVGGDEPDAMPFACALELIHTYSLIHDDLPAMDDDDLRRGQPTSHRVFGEAMAILAGDALHTLAFDLVLRETPDAEVARHLGRTLAEAAGFKGMVGGQVEDLAGGGVVPDAERLQRIHEQKTAALIEAAIRGGAIAGGAAPDTVDALSRYGRALGLAFQITDDVLDETGTAEELGKTPGKDRREGKMTYVALEGVEAARARAAAAMDRALAAIADLPSADLLVGLARFVTSRSR